MQNLEGKDIKNDASKMVVQKVSLLDFPGFYTQSTTQFNGHKSHILAEWHSWRAEHMRHIGPIAYCFGQGNHDGGCTANKSKRVCVCTSPY